MPELVKSIEVSKTYEVRPNSTLLLPREVFDILLWRAGDTVRYKLNPNNGSVTLYNKTKTDIKQGKKKDRD